MVPAKAFLEAPAGQLTAAMEEEFFSSLMTENKTYKTTFRNRFADVNRIVVPLLGRNAGEAISVLDIGISSGISTVELYDDLRAAGITATLVATDLSPTPTSFAYCRDATRWSMQRGSHSDSTCRGAR